MTNVVQMLRKCSGCAQEFPATREHFHGLKTGRHGLAGQCKTCHAVRCKSDAKTRRDADPEKVNAQARERMTKHRRKNGVPTKNYVLPGQEAERRRQYQDRYLANTENFIQYLLTHARIRNAKRHPETAFDLDAEWFREQFTAQAGKCFWMKVSLKLARNAGPCQVSLDRLDLGLGYLKTNTVLTCRVANMGRNDTTLEDFEVFLDDLRAAMMETA